MLWTESHSDIRIDKWSTEDFNQAQDTISGYYYATAVVITHRAHNL